MAQTRGQLAQPRSAREGGPRRRAERQARARSRPHAAQAGVRKAQHTLAQYLAQQLARSKAADERTRPARVQQAAQREIGQRVPIYLVKIDKPFIFKAHEGQIRFNII